MSDFRYYYDKVNEEANSFVGEYSKELIEDIESGASDVSSYITDRIYEWVDNDFIHIDLVDVAYIIENSNNVEFDNGLWEGESEPSKALETQAYYTYRTDLELEVRNLIREELDKRQIDLDSKLDELESELEELEDENMIDELEEEIDEIQSKIDYLQDTLMNI